MELQNFYGHETEIAGPDGKPATYMLHANKASTPTLKFHNHFPPDLAAWVVKIEHDEKSDPTMWCFCPIEQLSNDFSPPSLPVIMSKWSIVDVSF